MDLTDLAEAVRTADSVVAVGARTHFEVGGLVETGALEVRAPAGVVHYDPADLTVTVAAGTPVRELAEVLAAAGQECALDPRSPDATVGGVLAAGLSGHRRLRYGPVRDRVLEVRFLTADGRLVKGGGPTVKNVTGFDLPRLLVGSLGTIGVLTRAVLRCQPLGERAEWCVTDDDPFEVRRRTYRPSCIAWDGRRTHVLLEGVGADVEHERRAAGARPAGAPPAFPAGDHRGRVSVRPAALAALAADLDAAGVGWLAEVGVGTAHVAAGSEDALARARQAAARHGGWLLRETGAPGLDGFGVALPNLAVMRRIKDAFDPTGKLGPGRLPFGVRPAAGIASETAGV